MTYSIKKAKYRDTKDIMKIYSHAKDYMIANGNPAQWSAAYPNKKIIKNDIKNKCLYKLVEEGKIIACFAFIIGSEPTYAEIEDGTWNYDGTYATIHRMAVGCEGRGLSKLIFDFCREKFPYLRVDTHPNNRPMLRSIEKYDFKYAGIIYVRDGSKRLAFEKMFSEN